MPVPKWGTFQSTLLQSCTVWSVIVECGCHVAMQFALHMVRCCCREVAKQVVTTLRLRVLPLFIGERERERAVSFVHLRKWMCECFTLHLLGLHRFVTTLCTCVTPLVPVEWNQIASCCACLCGSASLSVWPPCRFLDQFCRLLQFSVPLIQFWLGHAGASSCSAFSSGGSNATFSLLHCNQLSTCLMNLGRTPLLHSACTIHSNIKEEMAGA